MCDTDVEYVAELAFVLCLPASVKRRAEDVIDRADVVVTEDSNDVVAVDAQVHGVVADTAREDAWLFLAPGEPGATLVYGELKPSKEVALESAAGLLETVDGFLYEVNLVFAICADLGMAGRVFHEDDLVVEEAALEKGGDKIVSRGLEPQASLDGNENTDRRVAQGR